MTKQQQQQSKTTLRRSSRLSNINSESVSSPPTISSPSNDFLLPTEHDQDDMTALWNNQETITRSQSNLPSNTVSSTQKKKELIRHTSITRRYSQRIREQKEKNATTQSNVPTLLLKNKKTLTHHSKQVILSTNQDSFNLTTLQPPSNLKNQTNNNIFNDKQQMSNDTKADVQRQQLFSSELMTVSPYYIPEVEIVIERYSSPSDDDNEGKKEEEEENDEEVKETVREVVMDEIADELVTEIEEDKEEEEYMDAEDSFDGDDSQPYLLEDNNTMQDDNTMETDTAATNNDLIELTDQVFAAIKVYVDNFNRSLEQIRDALLSSSPEPTPRDTATHGMVLRKTAARDTICEASRKDVPSRVSTTNSPSSSSAHVKERSGVRSARIESLAQASSSPSGGTKRKIDSSRDGERSEGSVKRSRDVLSERTREVRSPIEDRLGYHRRMGDGRSIDQRVDNRRDRSRVRRSRRRN